MHCSRLDVLLQFVGLLEGSCNELRMSPCFSSAAFMDAQPSHMSPLTCPKMAVMSQISESPLKGQAYNPEPLTGFKLASEYPPTRPPKPNLNPPRSHRKRHQTRLWMADGGIQDDKGKGKGKDKERRELRF